MPYIIESWSNEMEDSGDNFHRLLFILTQKCKHNFIREHININKDISYFNFTVKKNN